MGEYQCDTKYGRVDVFTKSIDDGWIAFVSPEQVPDPLPSDDGPVPVTEMEAVERLLARIERA